MKYKKNQFRLNLLTLSLSASGLLASSVSLAQQQNDSKAYKEEQLEVIEVQGIRGSLNRALGQKREAVEVTDSISAEDLGKFPDLNISESLQRIPGVTLDRNSNGEGQAINLRGLGPQFTRVEVNGMSGTSNGSGGRFSTSSGGRGFNFELLAAELFSNVTVKKTPTAKQTEGGMAGVVTLETPKPLSYEGTKFTVSAQGNHSEVLGETDPRGSVFFSHNIDDTFGISASVAYSDTHFRTNAVESGVWRPMNVVGRGESDDLIANGTRYYIFDEKRDTLGSTLSAQYRPSDNVEMLLSVLYATSDSERLANRNDMPVENPGVTSSFTAENGVVTAASFTGVQQRVGTNFLTTDEDFTQITFDTKWDINDNWQVRPFIGYSKRDAKRQFDLYSFRLAEDGVFDPGTVSYQVNGDFVDFQSTHTDFTSNPEDFLFNVFILRPSTDEDEEITGKLDFSRYFYDGPLTSIDFGVRYSEREKTRLQTQERLQRLPETGIEDVPSLADVFTSLPFKVAGSSAPNSQLLADPALIQSVFYPGGNAVDGTFVRPLPGFGASESWQISEDTFNAYVQANFDFDRTLFNAGLRLVRTEQTASGNIVENQFQPTENITPVSVSNSYTEYLPSANLRYELTDDVILRAAYSITLTRPDLPALAPSETISGIDEGGGTGSKGNPELQPFTSTNFDLGAEWYFEEEALLAANFFYKDIDGLIDTTSFTEVRSFPRQSDGVIVSGPIVFTQPENGVSASVQGAEFALQKPFTFLPNGIWQNFGGIFNLTITDSKADFDTVDDVRSSGLPGLSKLSYNASVYYDDGSLDMRLSYAWRERYLAQFSDDFGVPRFIDDFGQLDLSANYRVNDDFQLQMQVLNLTNEQLVNQATSLYLPYGVSELDRRILFGFRYSF